MSAGHQANWAAVGIGLLGLAGAVALSGQGQNQGRAGAFRHRRLAQPPVDGQISVRAARRLNRGSGVLAVSVLADSAVEHYRGSFHNKAMIAPLVSGALAIAASAHGVADRRPEAHRLRDTIYAAAGLTGLAGTLFHLWNVGRQPGGFSWLNLFYKAPVGAPLALLLSGLMGFSAERVRGNAPGSAPRLFGLPAGRLLAALTGGGLLGTIGEAGLMHFRGAFHNPAMYLPVTMPPVAAGLLAHAAIGQTAVQRRFSAVWLRLVALMGLAGSAFHVLGVARNMGGWRNWRQNLLNGPPIPAPPSFTGLALTGLAALGLLKDHPDA